MGWHGSGNGQSKFRDWAGGSKTDALPRFPREGASRAMLLFLPHSHRVWIVFNGPWIPQVQN